MTARRATIRVPPRVRARTGQAVVRVLTTTDHEVIGQLYLITSFALFLIAGVMALLIRSELAQPGLQIVNEEVCNQLFTMHGTIMLLLFATPLFIGFANVIMPVQIGAPDVAFPRLNMFSYWLPARQPDHPRRLLDASWSGGLRLLPTVQRDPPAAMPSAIEHSMKRGT